MKHFASLEFWKLYERLPTAIQRLADKNFAILKQNPQHPSLHFKLVGKYRSARVGAHYRAVAINDGEDLVWIWIGTHAEYDRMISS